MNENLLLPKPKLHLEGDFVSFLLIALLFHLVAYFWISQYSAKNYRKSGTLLNVHMLNEIKPPPLPKPKLKPPAPKPNVISKPQPAAPLLHIKQTKFHAPKNSTTPEHSNLQSIIEPKSGSPIGNPEGRPGGKGPIDESGPKITPLPVAPPPKPILPDRKNPGVLSRCSPPYPETERDQGIEGTVQILVVVGQNGQIAAAHVSGSSGNSELDRTALENVRECWKFAPAVQNGQPVEARLTFSIIFRLQ